VGRRLLRRTCYACSEPGPILGRGQIDPSSEATVRRVIGAVDLAVLQAMFGAWLATDQDACLPEWSPQRCDLGVCGV
jgi:hypothetical protein